MKQFQCFAHFLVFTLLAVSMTGQDSKDGAEAAFAQLKRAVTAWQQDRGPGQQGRTAKFVETALLSKDFIARYPDHPNAGEVRKIQIESLQRARSGEPEREQEWLELARAYVGDERNSRHDRFVVASTIKQSEVQSKKLKDRDAEFREYEKNAADLYAQFSDVVEVHYLFLGLARNAPATKARKLVADILNGDAPAHIKMEAQAVVDRLDMPGKKVPLTLSLNNGSSFDLSRSAGRAVVIYIWSKQGGASAAALPAIRAASKAFDALFIGINIDNDPHGR